ncbi:hypothetical protein [Actinomadura sp. NPDC049753]
MTDVAIDGRARRREPANLADALRAGLPAGLFSCRFLALDV